MEHVKHMCQAFEQDTWELISLSEGQQRMDISNMGSLNTLVLAGALDCSYPSTCFHVRHMYCSSDYFKVHLTHLTLKISVFFLSACLSTSVGRWKERWTFWESTTWRHPLVHFFKWSNQSHVEELGVQPPVGFWDPAGLSKDGDVETFQRRRSVELKHGRSNPWWKVDGFWFDLIRIWFGCVTDICLISPFSIILIHFYSETMSYNVIVHLRLAGKDRPVKAYLDWLFVRLSTIDDPWLYYSNAFSGNVAQDCNAGHHGSLWLHDVVSYHISIIYI